MQIVSINTVCKNNSVELALRKANYKLRAKRVAWPRAKGVAAVRIDCGSGRAVEFVAKTNSAYLVAGR